MQEAASERLRLENDLRLALVRGEFELHFQPQVDARDNRVIGTEALLRWKHPTLGPQSPAQFIQVLEESGLIVEVGSWVLAEACRACGQLFAEGLASADDFSLCVNISPRQFRQSDFVERIEKSLADTHLPRSILKLEITEGIVIQNLDDTIGKMRRLKKLGVSFAMDDFGTGYSSLTYLKRLPVDVLKIDQSFVRDATNDPNDAEIIRAIVAMARSLGLGMVAEGWSSRSNWTSSSSRAATCTRATCSASRCRWTSSARCWPGTANRAERQPPLRKGALGRFLAACASDQFSSTGRLALIGMRLGLASSGTMRTRSMFSRPFCSPALRTSMWSARRNDSLKARWAMPWCR